MIVCARDPERHQVLLGGLGALGVGTMWTDDKEDYHNLPGYDEAPTQWSWTWEEEQYFESLRPAGGCIICGVVKSEEQLFLEDEARVAFRAAVLDTEEFEE